MSSETPRRPQPLGPAVALAVLLFLLPGGLAVLWQATAASWLPIQASFTLIELGGILVPTLLLAWNLRRSDALRWRRAPLPFVAWACAGAAGLAGILSHIQTFWERSTGYGPPEGLEVLLRIQDPAGGAWLLLGAVLLPAFAEETAFRGFLQSRLERFGPIVAIACTSALFALFHHDAYGVPTYLAMGAFLGYLSWKSGSVWPAAAAHGTNNLLALLQANGLPEEWWWQHVAIVLPVSLALAALALWRLLARPGATGP